jgi:exodeoxyribonuclease VII small subunit
MKNNTTIKEQLQQLDELISWFESDDFTLEEAVEKFKAAEQLAEDIRRKLSSLKSDITVLGQKFDTEA